MEKWKVIRGDTNYMVSTLGRVKNITTQKIHRGKHIKHSDGYVIYRLVIDGISKQYRAHRLVAQEFLPNPDNLPVVNHRNGRRDDNRLTNLEWCSYKQNSYHSKNVTKNSTSISKKKFMQLYREYSNLSLIKFVGRVQKYFN